MYFQVLQLSLGLKHNRVIFIFVFLFPVVLHRGDLWVRKCHGCHSCQWRYLPDNRRACVKHWSCSQHPEPHAFLWHVWLLRRVCLPCESLGVVGPMAKRRVAHHSALNLDFVFLLFRWVCLPNLAFLVLFCWWCQMLWVWCVGPHLWIVSETASVAFTSVRFASPYSLMPLSLIVFLFVFRIYFFLTCFDSLGACVPF